MSFNTDQIVQEIRAGFESMMAPVQDGKNATADETERDVYWQVLGLGGQLMQLFFALRSEACLRTPMVLKDGTELPYWCEKQRIYCSIFGKLPVMRPCFYAADKGSASPLDEELSLGADCYSDLLRELVEYLGTDVTYKKVSGSFQRLLGHSLSTYTVQKLMADDAADVEANYQHKPAPDPINEATILVAQADCEGMLVVRETPVEATERRSLPPLGQGPL